MNNEETFYQAMRRQGVTRRSFLKYCSLAATSLGLGAGMAPKIAWALENKPRIPVVWIHGLECTCCTESFIRSAHPLAKDVILSLISLDYDDTLMAAAGTQAEEVFEDIIAQYNGKYILAVEGNPPLGEQGMFCISSGRPFIEKLKRAAAGASAIIAWGTCASWGCVQAARPNPTQATPIDKVITDKPIIKVPGCPPIPDVMSAIITYMVTFDRLPDVDRMGRPLMFYGQRIHDKCYRRPTSTPESSSRVGMMTLPAKVTACTKWVAKGQPPITPVPPPAGMMAFLSQSSLVTAAWAVRKMVSGIAVRSTAAWSIFRKWVLIPLPIPSV